MQIAKLDANWDGLHISLPANGDCKSHTVVLGDCSPSRAGETNFGHYLVVNHNYTQDQMEYELDDIWGPPTQASRILKEFLTKLFLDHAIELVYDNDRQSDQVGKTQFAIEFIDSIPV